MISRRRGLLVGLVSALTLVVAGVGLLAAHTHRLDRACTGNLERIFAALNSFVDENGTLPGLALYPDDPLSDDDSLLVVLRQFGIEEKDLVCPATNPILQAAGNTYVWNTRLSGKHWSDIETAQWMLVEINAMSSHVAAPHGKRYHVLYSNGEVRSESNPPAVL